MRILLSLAARRDLVSIWSYTARRWNDAQADRYVRLIADQFDRLAAGTVQGRMADDLRVGYFKLAVGSHLAFYRISGNTIQVMRVLHRRMDFDQH